MENFEPDFEIKTCSAKDFMSLTQSFPQSYYIKNDSIIAEFSGELLCYLVFKSIFEQKY